MATQNDIRIKSYDSEGKVLATRTFQKTIIAANDTTNQKGLANAYIALIEADTNTAQHIQYKDIDLD